MIEMTESGVTGCTHLDVCPQCHGAVKSAEYRAAELEAKDKYHRVWCGTQVDTDGEYDVYRKVEK